MQSITSFVKFFKNWSRKNLRSEKFCSLQIAELYSRNERNYYKYLLYFNKTTNKNDIVNATDKVMSFS